MGTFRKFLYSFIPLFLLLLALEFVLFVFPPSDGNGLTLAAQRWKEKYWKPVNSLGYRDRELSSTAHSGKKLMLVIGDSFAAGYGIRSFKDCLASQLQFALPETSSVALAAKPGWGPLEELNALATYPAKPSVIVLVYVYNDIVPVAAEFNVPLPSYTGLPENFLKVFIERSHLVNFLYWKFIQIRSGKRVVSDIASFEEKIYSNPQIVKRHLEQEQAIVSWAKKNHSRLVVVCFPDLSRISTSREKLEPVIRFFEANADGVIDVANTIASHRLKSIVVNPSDKHPSEELIRQLVIEIKGKVVGSTGIEPVTPRV